MRLGRDQPVGIDAGRWLYQLIAPVYDSVSGERTLYANARTRAINLLHLQPGATVLDVACGTGRNHELIQRQIGPAGQLVGVDRSPRMLAQARQRTTRRRWTNVTLVETDVTDLTRQQLDRAGAAPPAAGFDAVLCTLGLSVIPDWRSAYRTMLGLVRPGGRIAVLDAGYPAKAGQAGEVVAFRPTAWLLCRAFAADPRRQPWELVSADSDNVTVERYTWGFIGIAAGTVGASGAAR